MKLSRKWILVAALVLSVAMATSGTLAYLTDRESATNVFTFGNVDIELNETFGQGAQLIPGKDINKLPSIENTGKTNAWVWMTLSIPAELDVPGSASDNVIHWNWTGATDEEIMSETSLQKAHANGWISEDITMDMIKANNWTWDMSGDAYETEIGGKAYHSYDLLYNAQLAPGEKTLPGIVKVYMDAHIDIDPEGNLHHVQNGNVTDIDWNINENGAPTIYIAAYAIQTEGFTDIDTAYEAYTEQWGKNGGVEYDVPVTLNVTDSEGLKAAIEDNQASNVIINLATGNYDTNLKVPGGKNIVLQGTGINTVLAGQIASTSSTAGTLTLRDLTVKVDSAIKDSTGIFQTSKTAIALWGNQKVVCDNVTFEMSLKDSTAITTWWDTNEGTSVTVKNCTFNCNGQRPIRSTGNVTVENCTFNDPYRYAVQLTAKASTATELDKAIINFNNNTIVNGPSGKDFVYGIQMEGADYGCNNCVINGTGNEIVNGGSDSAMYYCECGKVDHATIEWHTEVPAKHEN